MKKTRLGALVALIALGVMASFVSTASATPTRTSPCSNCHDGAGAAITTTYVSTAGNQATYSYSAPGADYLSVFNGTTRVTTVAGASGQFAVTTGGVYTLFAVTGPSTSSGLATAILNATPPVPVDVTAPVTTSDAKATYVSSAAVKLTATDAGGSGVANTYYKLDGGAQVTGTAINVATVGSHTIEFWSVDVAGNAETHKTAGFTITAPPTPVDVTAPVTTSDAKATYVSSAAVKLTATDADGSGVANTYYKLDGGAQVTGTAINVATVGSHTIEFWSVDVAGNAETHKTAGFTITAAPVPDPDGTTATTLSIRASGSGRDDEDDERHSSRRISLSGKLTGGDEDLRVALYVMKPGSKVWTLVKTIETSDSDESNGGSWKYRYSASSRGTYKFQARFAGTSELAPSVSKVITVKVR